jgi:hypothetical protein
MWDMDDLICEDRKIDIHDVLRGFPLYEDVELAIWDSLMFLIHEECQERVDKTKYL